MKKLFTAILFALISLSVFAQDYRHSFGIIAGSYNGISYKFHPGENYAMQLDLGANINLTPYGSARYRYGGYVFDLNGEKPIYNVSYQLNPNFMWQGELTDNFYFFAGGGFSLGIIWCDFDFYTHTGYHVRLQNTSEAKFGVNGIMGFEYCWEETPLTLGFDFRPGYGAEYDHVTPDISYERHFFDWSLSLALRYTF